MARMPFLMIPSRIAPSGGVEISTQPAGTAPPLGPLTPIGNLLITPVAGTGGLPALSVVFDA
jgi:hypothetical protein